MGSGPGDSTIPNPERLWGFVGYTGRLGDLEGGRPLVYHVKPERVDFRVGLAEALEFKEGAGADWTARRVLEEQETVSGKEEFKFSVYGKSSEGHQRALESVEALIEREHRA
jgi:hypothetical protein